MKTRYEIRRWDALSSKSIGFKGKLFDRKTAQRIAKRLKKSGIAAYIAPMQVNV